MIAADGKVWKDEQRTRVIKLVLVDAAALGHHPRGVLFDRQNYVLASRPFSDLDNLNSDLAHLVCDLLFRRLKLFFHVVAAIERRGTGVPYPFQVGFQMAEVGVKTPRAGFETFGTRTGPRVGNQMTQLEERFEIKSETPFLERLQTQDPMSALKLNRDSKHTFGRHVGLVSITDQLAYDTP